MSAWGDMPGRHRAPGDDDGAGHLILIRPRAEVEQQARDALDELERANGGTLPATLRAAYDVDRAAYARLIEALVQLGAEVDLDTARLAGLRSVEEAIE